MTKILLKATNKGFDCNIPCSFMYTNKIIAHVVRVSDNYHDYIDVHSDIHYNITLYNCVNIG